MFITKRKYNMKMSDADQTLQNVFAELDVAPNTVPFDKIVLRGIANTLYVKSCRIIATVFLFLTLFAPLLFINQDFSVNTKDVKDSIVITDHHLEDSSFQLLLSGNNINYSDIYARKPDGTFVFPSLTDEENGVVIFPFDGTTLNIYIPDKNGKILQAILSTQKEF